MFTGVGKYLELIQKEKISKYSDVQLDILWYLTNLTKINRLISKEAIREFLVRYFLVTGADIDTTAAEFIDHGTLIEGTIETKGFSLSVKEMMDLAGFGSTGSKYAIEGTLENFIEGYKYKAPNIKLSQGDKENEINISADALVYSFMGVGTLLLIDSLSLKFRDDLKGVTTEEIQKAVGLADFVVAQIEDNVFTELESSFPGLREYYEERFYPDKKIRFDVFKDMSRENLIEIYKHILAEEDVNKFRELDVSDEDFVGDLAMYNEHIVFAYGVKHGYIQLTDDLDSMHHDYDAYFDIDADHLMGDEGQNYPSKDIYENWGMENWIHLVP